MPTPEKQSDKCRDKSKKLGIFQKTQAKLKELKTSCEFLKQFEKWEINVLKDYVDLTNAKKLKEVVFYKPRFNAEDIVALMNLETDKEKRKIISAKTAKQYPKRFDGWSIVGLVQTNIDYKTAASYPDRFDSTEIITLVQAGIDGEKAKLYPNRFSAAEIAAMHNAGIMPEQIVLYPKDANGWKIVGLAKSESKPEDTVISGPINEPIVFPKGPGDKNIL